MTYELPKRKHIVMKAIEPANLSPSVAALAVAAATWTEIKYDGCAAVLIKDNGKVYAYNRQANVVEGAFDHIIKALENIPDDNFVLFGEAWHPDLIFSVINGAFRKRFSGLDAVNGTETKYPALYLMVFDMVTLDEFKAGYSDDRYLARRSNYCEFVERLARGPVENWDCARFIDVAEGGPDKDEIAEIVDQYRNGTRSFLCEGAKPIIFPTDGYIKRNPDAPWVAGAGSEGHTLKDKDRLTVDLVIEGIIEGQGKFVGMVGALQATYKGQAQRIQGGSLTDKQRKAMFKDPSLIVGKVWEVHALGESTNGLLREPRLSHERTDKTAEEADQ